MNILSSALSKITRRHLERKACVYVRQSTMAQVFGHLESQQRQYELVERAKSLGWATAQIVVIDQDLGQSGADGGRAGFRQLSWGELVRQLSYKCEWKNRTFVQIDKFSPSSQRCSTVGCGYHMKKMPLHIRTWGMPFMWYNT